MCFGVPLVRYLFQSHISLSIASLRTHTAKCSTVRSKLHTQHVIPRVCRLFFFGRNTTKRTSVVTIVCFMMVRKRIAGDPTQLAQVAAHIDAAIVCCSRPPMREIQLVPSAGPVQKREDDLTRAVENEGFDMRCPVSQLWARELESTLELREQYTNIGTKREDQARFWIAWAKTQLVNCSKRKEKSESCSLVDSSIEVYHGFGAIYWNRRFAAVVKLLVFDDGENEEFEHDVRSFVDKTTHLTTAVLTRVLS